MLECPAADGGAVEFEAVAAMDFGSGQAVPVEKRILSDVRLTGATDGWNVPLPDAPSGCRWSGLPPTSGRR
jgi:hypothetical protein